MKLYAIKFRDCGEKEYKTAIFSAKDIDCFRVQTAKFLKDNEEIDKRTISWAGEGVPLTVSELPYVIHANIDDFL